MTDDIAEVWCDQCDQPAAEIVKGVPFCSLCLWKLRSPSWRIRR